MSLNVILVEGISIDTSSVPAYEDINSPDSMYLYQGKLFLGRELTVEGNEVYVESDGPRIVVYPADEVYEVLPGDDLRFEWTVEISLANQVTYVNRQDQDPRTIEEGALEERVQYALPPFDHGDITSCKITLIRVFHNEVYLSTVYTAKAMRYLNILNSMAIGEEKTIDGLTVHRTNEQYVVNGNVLGFHEAFTQISEQLQ